MANGFILGVFELDLTPIGERRVQLPIRLGRSSLNDVPVSHRLVSEFHARIEEVDGKLCVRDLSSKNGVFVEAVGSEVPARVPAQRPIELEPYGFEFLLSPLLRVRVRPAEAQGVEAQRLSQAHGSVLGNAALLGNAGVPGNAALLGTAGSRLAEDKLTDCFGLQATPGAGLRPASGGPPAPQVDPVSGRHASAPAAPLPTSSRPPLITSAAPGAPSATPLPASAPTAPRVEALPPRAALDVARPALDVARPALDLARPALDLARPALDLARPALDLARPALDVARPALDVARPAPLHGAYAPQARPASPLSASPAVQPYASVFVEGSAAPLELPPVPDSAPRLGTLPPVAAGPGETRLSHPVPARAATVLEPPPAAASAPRLAQTAWEIPSNTAPAGLAGKPSPEPSGFQTTSLEALALRGLRELAGSLLPGQQLEHAGDVVQLVTKLHDAIEMFCRCFLPVREACSRFTPLEDLERAAIERCRYRSSAYLAIEQALEPRALAAALIDWRNDAQDAPAAVENILADLMRHHLALSQGAIEGTQRLLRELSPARIEAQTAAEPSVLSKLGLASARERALWDTYAERHARFEGIGETFRDAFGDELTRAYAAHWQARGGGETSTR